MASGFTPEQEAFLTAQSAKAAQNAYAGSFNKMKGPSAGGKMTGGVLGGLGGGLFGALYG